MGCIFRFFFLSARLAFRTMGLAVRILRGGLKLVGQLLLSLG